MWYIDDDEFGAAVEVVNDSNYNYVKKDKLSSIDNKGNHQSRISFKEKVKDSSKGLSLFGTVPPPTKLSIEQVSGIAAFVAESIRELQPDGIAVYDIQDEPSRNGTPRPFPFSQTHDPRMYAHLLENLAPQTEAIIFRSLSPNQTAREFEGWLSATVNEFHGKNIVLVGGGAGPDETILSVKDAAKIISEKQSQIFMGGITIPERHRDRGNEHIRIAEKVDQGISFFTSQVVYNADNAIGMLRDYDEYCKANSKEPARIVFTFAPFGTESTVRFLRWLGVELPEGTVKRVLLRPDLKSRINESKEICWENWRRILEASKRMKIKVPIGFSVESVSKSKMEQEAAVQLFSNLRDEMNLYYKSYS